ncbi:MAG: GNAT family N-acetyltransferase [Desulfurococcales archaeon]|jgi:ribosomal protein S18 acetylase RimI-like enzyme|nr:GNAT family N-acetyltransferase [Desulfurococcales archaeon]
MCRVIGFIKNLYSGAYIAVRLMGDNDVKVLFHRDFSSLEVIRVSMGRWHYHFAKSIKDLGGVVVDLILLEKVVGQSVVYTIKLGQHIFGVIYYIAVLPEYRGRGHGKILLVSAEEILSDMSSEYILATISGDNKASLKLFESLDYKLYSWNQISRECGRRLAELVRMITCGYEDDIVAIKNMLQEPIFPGICGIDRNSARRWWRSACLKPWLDLRRGW